MVVESEAFRAARKKRYREAMSAGPRATLEKGRMMDELHNVQPEVEHVRSGDEILREAREEAESIPVRILIEGEEPKIVDTAIELDTRELPDGMVEVSVAKEQHIIEDVEDAMPVEEEQKVEEEQPKEEKNETLSELEQLSARIAQLERELKEKGKENSTE